MAGERRMAQRRTVANTPKHGDHSPKRRRQAYVWISMTIKDDEHIANAIEVRSHVIGHTGKDPSARGRFDRITSHPVDTDTVRSDLMISYSQIGCFRPPQ